MNKKHFAILSVAVACAWGGSFTDSRDGQVYKTVKIGMQTWMAENLNYKMKSSWCYDNDASICKIYGRLYPWDAAFMACPSGWHLPSEEEFWTLIETVGGEYVTGKRLKSKYGWKEEGNGTDAYGFSGLPAGYRYSDGVFYNAGYEAVFWSATEYDASSARNMLLSSNADDATLYYSQLSKVYAFSVRCLKDSD